MKITKKIGFHISISGGLDLAIERAVSMGIDTLQIFLKNSNRWISPDLSDREIQLFRDRWKMYPDLNISAHSGYLINPAGDGENLEKSIALLKDELIRSDRLGIKKLVLHPGNHKDKGLTEGIKTVVNTLDEVFSEVDSEVIILLETTAGQGTSIGHRFEHIRDIISLSKYQERLGVCLDTCHIFAAGYDFSTEDNYNKVINEFDQILGIEKLKLFHLNDSKKNHGSKIDRHEHIGLGYIGYEGIGFFLNDRRFDEMDFILETPEDEIRSDLDNYQAVISLMK